MNTFRALPAPFVLAAPALLLFLAACAPKYYSPNAQNVPLLRSAGEGSVGASVNPEANRADARGAFAVGRNVGLMANASMYFPRDDDSGNGGRGGLFEVGAGYFRPMARDFVFETYGLLAYGGVENHFETANPGGTLNANLVRVAVQPAIGYRHRWVEAAVSSRIAMLNYFNVSGDLMRGGESEEEYLRENRQQFLLEPAVTVRVGPEVLKAEVQLGRSLNLGDGDFPQDAGWGSLGLVYYFAPR